MFSWSVRKKIFYGGGLIILAAAILIFPVLFLIREKPSCADGKRNQGESGVDCGGPCPKICEAALLKPIIDWSRSFETDRGAYHALASVINPNTNFGARRLYYKFSLFDEKNVAVAERYGYGSLPPGRPAFFFESRIATGERKVARTTFEIVENPSWEQASNIFPDVRVTDQKLVAGDKPKLSAVVRNQSRVPLVNLEVIAVLYGENDNAVSVSKTVIDFLGPDSSAEVYFTWRSSFPEKVVRTEIMPQLYPGINF
jgi:hypothetical protein